MERIHNEKLYALLRDFYRATGRRIAIFDPDGNLLMEYPHERCTFCTTVRRDGGGSLCMQSDKSGFKAAAQKGTVIYRCHAGLIEVCCAIAEKGEIAGYLMFGQLRYKSDAKADYLYTHSKARSFFASDYLFESAYRDLQHIDEESLQSLVNIVQTCVGYIQLEQMANLQQKGLWDKIKEYIENNFSKGFTLNNMAIELSVSVPTLCKCARDNSGKTVITLVTEKRIEKAKALLSGTSLSIAEIADKVGIGDYNYFSRVFKSQTSSTPTAWRKQHTAHKDSSSVYKSL